MSKIPYPFLVSRDCIDYGERKECPGHHLGSVKSACLSPHAMLERKPPHGQPCNQCGLCCYAMPCALGAALFATRAGPCPALRFQDNGDSYCDVVAHPEQYSATARRAPQFMRLAALSLIRAGDGCDCRVNDEPCNEAFEARLDANDDPRLCAQARYLWAIPED
jgi:hypothetical protein